MIGRSPSPSAGFPAGLGSASVVLDSGRPTSEEGSRQFSESEPPAEAKGGHVSSVAAVLTAPHTGFRLPSTSVGKITPTGRKYLCNNIRHRVAGSSRCAPSAQPLCRHAVCQKRANGAPALRVRQPGDVMRKAVKDKSAAIPGRTELGGSCQIDSDIPLVSPGKVSEW